MPFTKSLKIIAIIVVLVIVGCTAKQAKVSVPEQTGEIKTVTVKEKWEVFPLGDTDNDKVPDTAFVYTPAYKGEISPEEPEIIQFAGCINEKCYNRIKFSAGLPEILIENSLWGTIEPIGDLDEDGMNEFIFQTNWWISTHVNIIIYSFDKEINKWTVLATNNLYGEDSYKDRVTKITKHQFRFSIEYMDTIEQNLSTKDTLIDIKK